jgi:ubiquinone biosynthesis protein COQ9
VSEADTSASALDPADMTLAELRLHLAPLIADAAIFDGWSEEALAMAADQAGVDRDVARLAFKGKSGLSQMAMIEAWIATIDREMAERMTPEKLGAMKVRERIRSLVQFRLDAVRGQEEALRRATAIMAMPQNAAASLKTGWSSADLMWRLAGDTATDWNHYTKRTILAGIYGATLAVFVSDESEDKQETRAFLDRRIDGVMKFEKAKAQLLGRERESFSMMRFLGRLRYPVR